MNKFTPEQNSIINAGKQNLFVSASAGSGKTTVMINRIAKLLSEGKTTIDRILVVTFTENSASDMKNKLYKILSEEALTNKKCYNALFGIGASDISTIHQFCKRIIEKYFYLAGVDPAFTILSEAESEVIKNKAFEKVILKQNFASPEKMDSLVDNYFEKRNLETIKKILYSIYNYLNVCDDKEGWIKNTLSKGYETNLNVNKSADVVCEYAKSLLSPLVKELESTLVLVKNFNYQQFELPVTSMISIMKQLVETSDNEQFIHALTKADVVKYPISRSGEAGAFREEVIAPLFKTLKASLVEAKKLIGSENIEDVKRFLESGKNNLEFLAFLAEEFIKEYSLIKKEKTLLDFNDLEEKALLILSNEEALSAIKSSYDYCFVDEYQDVNTIQEAILSSISGKNNYFGVGDAKQSIYGFRLCSPEIFIKRFNNAMLAGKNEAKVLNKNFRSKLSILNFVNKVFEKIMTEKTCQIDYRKTGVFDTDDASKECNVEVITLEKPQQKALEVATGVYSVMDEAAENESNLIAKKEGHLIANQIQKLVKQGASLSDISILTRRKGGDYVKAITNQLTDEGISVFANYSLNLLDEYEVAVLHNLICLISNCKRDAILVKVMTSPIFNFSYEELYTIAQGKAKFFYEKVFNDEALKNPKIRNFIEEIEALRLESQALSLADLVRKIISRYNYVTKISRQNKNAEQNILAYIQTIEGLKIKSLTAYESLTASGELNIKGESIVNENSSSVAINTIHSSKGLEYPYVILAGAGNKFNTQSLKMDEALFSSELGVGLKTVNLDTREKQPNIAISSIRIQKEKELIAEEIRLLYVALTRAQNKLIITGVVDNNKIRLLKTDDDVLKSETFLDLIIGSLNAREIEEFKNGSAKAIYADQHVATLNKLKWEDLSENAIVVSKSARMENKETTAKIKKNLVSINMPVQSSLKNTVTQINKLSTEEEGVNQMFNEGEKSFAEQGNAYHKLLQNFDFNSDNFNIALQSLTSSEKALIDTKLLNKFLKSDVYKLAKGKSPQKELCFLYQTMGDDLFSNCDNSLVLLQGVIDLLIENDHSFIIVDYKASGASKETVVKRYSKQLKLYKEVAEGILNKKCEKILIYLIFSGQTIEIE